MDESRTWVLLFLFPFFSLSFKLCGTPVSVAKLIDFLLFLNIFVVSQLGREKDLLPHLASAPSA